MYQGSYADYSELGALGSYGTYGLRERARRRCKGTLGVHGTGLVTDVHYYSISICSSTSTLSAGLSSHPPARMKSEGDLGQQERTSCLEEADAWHGWKVFPRFPVVLYILLYFFRPAKWYYSLIVGIRPPCLRTEIHLDISECLCCLLTTILWSVPVSI